MKHLSQQMLSMELRRPHIKRYRRGLQEQLRHPGLHRDQRERIMAALALAGEQKLYTLDEPPQPGALDPGPMPVMTIELETDDMTFESLSTLSHSRLFHYARQEGLEIHPGDNKAVIVNAILAAPQGEER